MCLWIGAEYLHHVDAPKYTNLNNKIHSFQFMTKQIELQVMKFADRIHGKITFSNFRFSEIVPVNVRQRKMPENSKRLKYVCLERLFSNNKFDPKRDNLIKQHIISKKKNTQK